MIWGVAELQVEMSGVCENCNTGTGLISWRYIYRGADMSLAGLGRKQANVSVRMARISFGALHVLSILQGC